MPTFKELSGQTSQGIDGFNRVITINYNELTANSAAADEPSSQNFDFGVLKGAKITRALVITRGLRFTDGHANSGDGTDNTKPTTVTVGVGDNGTGSTDAEKHASAGTVYTTADDGVLAGTGFLLTVPNGNYIPFNNTAKLRVQVKTTGDGTDLNTASAGKIHIFLAVVEWKDLDTHSGYLPST